MGVGSEAPGGCRTLGVGAWMALGVLAGVLFAGRVSAQTYFLKETFSNAGGTQPPAGWQCIRLSGGPAPGFRFDNPRSVQTVLPLQAPFALFDAPASPLLGTSQSVTLESPAIDLTGVTRLLLSFDHQFAAASESVGRLQARVGGVWSDVAVYSASTNGGVTEVYDLSPQLAVRTDAAIRFLWSGKADGHWAVDNVKLFAPLPVDAGISSIDMPKNPFGEGTTDIRVTLANYGSSVLNGVDIHWSVNGIRMRDTSWSGSLDFAARETDIRIGRMDMRAGVNYIFKIWTEDPNAVLDANPSNDTIVRSLIPSLCGTYTIGGANPNFPTVTRAVEFLHSAGIGCPVVMKIRDGIYNEQLELKTVKGSSPVNTVTFESESGDSTKVLLTSPADITSYRYTMNLDGARHVRFRKMGFSKLGDGGFHALAISGKSYDIRVENCRFIQTGNGTSNIFVIDDADSVLVRNSDFNEGYHAVNMSTTGSVRISDNRFRNWFYIPIAGGAARLFIERNLFERSEFAMNLNVTDTGLISHNRIRFANLGIRLYGPGRIRVDRNLVNFSRDMGIYSEASRPIITNNRVWNEANTDLSSQYGIYVAAASGARVLFNTVRMVRGSYKAAALAVNAVDSVEVNSNILSMSQSGYPFLLTGRPRVLLADRNSYHSRKGLVGQLGTTGYKSMQDWRAAISGEARGLAIDPGFRNDSSFLPTLIYLDGTGKPATGVLRDFDDSLRSAALPDVGASEFRPCPRDAAVEAVEEPTTPIQTGMSPVKVRIRNNGTDLLTSVRLSWSVNGSAARDTLWNGSLASAQTELFTLGSHAFTNPKAGYAIRVWIRRDSGDCHAVNDTLTTERLYARLCGTYTVGGVNPDFRTLTEAVEPLMTAGISCPVVIRMRDGVYEEQVRIDSIAGSSAVNTVTIESESGDSSRVMLKSAQSLNAIRYTLGLNGTRHLRLQRIGIEKEADNRFMGLVVEGSSFDIQVNRCLFQTRVGDAGNVLVEGRPDSIRILESRFTGPAHNPVHVHTSGTVRISGNLLTGDVGYAIRTVSNRIVVSGNHIRNAGYGIVCHVFSDTSYIGENRIYNSSYGITVRGHGAVHVHGNHVRFNGYQGIHSEVQRPLITNNWVYDGTNAEARTEHGIFIHSSERGRALFNSVQLVSGTKQSSALMIEGGDSLFVSSNILSMAQYGYPVYVNSRPRGLGIDRNNYYSKYGWLGWQGNVHVTDMADWRNRVRGEANGFSANPFFLNDTTLVPGQIFLDGRGLTGTTVDKDIDGIARDPAAPDIGAKEFTPCQQDAGIASILEPASPLDVGVRRVRVVLQNNGRDTLTRIRVGWTVNGSPMRDTLWQGVLPSAQTTTMDIGAFDFRPVTEYVIKAWIGLAAPGTDCSRFNDTVSSNKLFVRLCGTYTIGGVNPDFRNFSDAAAFLESAGVSCPVVFKVRNGTYDEMVQIDSVMGASPVNNITFESESGDSSKVLLMQSGATVATPYALNLNGSRYLRFRRMGFSKAGDGNYTAVLLTGNCMDIRLENCHFLQGPSGSKNLHVGDGSDSIRVSHSYFSGNSYMGVSLGTSGGVSVSDNRFGPSVWHAVYGSVGRLDFLRNTIQNNALAVRLSVSDSANLSGNRITGSQNGMILEGAGRYLVQGNRIGFTTGTGLHALGIKQSLLANNWVYNEQRLSTNGILMENCEQTRVLFNTVDISGTNNNSSAIAIKDGRGLSVFNNILRNASGGYCMKLVNGSPGLMSDYNGYYAPLNNIGSIDDRIYNYLSQWGTVIGGEAHSLFVNPFLRAGDYRPNHILLNDAGVRYDPVTRDIDSAARHPVSPDIGVKEFTPCNLDAGINELVSPTLPIGSGRQDIKVVLQNQGLSTLSQVRIHWSINGAAMPSYLWSGTLPTRRNTPVTIGDFDFISGPEWTLRVWTSSPNGGVDCNVYNDTAVLFVAGTPNSVPFPPQAKDTSVCKGNVATLRATGAGTIGWYTAATGGRWLGGGSTFTTPPLTGTVTYYVQDSMLTASLARTPVRVTVFDPPPFDPFPAAIYSRADSLVLLVDSSSSPASIAWNNGEQGNRVVVEYSGGYRVNIVTRDGCRLTDTVFVQFPDTAGIRIGQVTASCTLPVEVPVKVFHFRRIGQWQGSMRWDTARLRFDSLRTQGPAALDMTPADFDLSRTAEGRLAYRWQKTTPRGRSLPDSTTVFWVRLIPITSELAAFPVSVTDTLSPVRFRDDRDTLLLHARINGAVQVATCNMILQGLVHTPTDDGVQNVEIRLTGTEPKTTLTDRNGLYGLVVRRGDYTLTPFKNNERLRLNGISTIDLAFIQSHILFRQRLNDPYKVIAADADSSSTVTTSDIMHIRRMLLGLDTSLPGNRTWAFVDADQTFPNANNPFPYRNRKTFAGLFGPVTQRFRAVKLGDVNYDRNPKLDQGPSRDTLRLYTEVSEEPGLVRVSIRTKAVQRLMGFQGTLQWDTRGLRLLQAQPMGLGIGLGTVDPGRATLPFSWNDPQALGLSLTDGFPLLEMVFERTGLASGSDIRLTGGFIEPEAFNVHFERMHFRLESAGVRAVEGASVIRILPNPVRSQLTVEWYAERREPVRFRVIDAQGRALEVGVASQRIGLNRAMLDLGRSAGSGLCLLGIEDAQGVRWVRFLRVR